MAVLRNQWWQRLIFRQVTGYVSESVLRLLISALVGIFVARYLGPDGLGLLSYAGSIFALLSPLAMLGMRSVLVREFSTGDNWQVISISALGRQLPVALVTSILGLVIIATTRNFDHDALLIGLALSPLPFLATGDNLRALYEASEGRVRIIVTTGIVATAFASLAKTDSCPSGRTNWAFAAATTLEAALVVVGYLVGYRGRNRSDDKVRHFDSTVARNLLRESWPLLIAGMAVMIYMRSAS